MSLRLVFRYCSRSQAFDIIAGLQTLIRDLLRQSSSKASPVYLQWPKILNQKRTAIFKYPGSCVDGAIPVDFPHRRGYVASS
jgi:hypothetical protein